MLLCNIVLNNVESGDPLSLLPVLHQSRRCRNSIVLLIRDFFVLPREIKPGDDRDHDEENEGCHVIPPESIYQDTINGNGTCVNREYGQEKF